MSSYRFTLKNYHAVKEADIKIDGITVLSGINSSGKSTVSRWLYYIVKVLNEYDKMVDDEALSKFSFIIFKISRSIYAISDKDVFETAFQIQRELDSTTFHNLSETSDFFERTLMLLRSVLERGISKDIALSDLKKYDSYFDTTYEGVKSVGEYIDNVISKLEEEYKQISYEANDKKKSRLLEDFSIQLKRITDSRIDADNKKLIKLTTDFYEDGTGMFTADSFKMPLNLRNVIYINTQNIGLALINQKDNDLSEMLSEKRTDISSNANNLTRLIQSIIGGDISVKKGNKTPNGIRKTYSYNRQDGLSIDLLGAATGIISFSYLLQLIKNGWIDDGTLFIIDEPECHLHPQWVVDYARMLVLLFKNIGTKVLISSHNPDLVSAIQSIAEKEGVLEKTNFYLAKQPKTNSKQYVFENLGTNIEKIFDSFNIAIDRIADYGRIVE